MTEPRKAKTYFPVYLGFRISKELDDAIWKAADAAGLDRSKWLREKLQDFVSENGKKK